MSSLGVTDRDLAELVFDLYAYPDSPRVAWDYLDDGRRDPANIYWAARWLAGGELLACCCRGSTWESYGTGIPGVDWLHDLLAAFPDPGDNPLGLALGFDEGTEVMARTAAGIAAGKPMAWVGHSLGASRATDGATHSIQAGATVLARVVWGEPLSGGEGARRVLSAIPHQVSYCNRVDGVSDPVVTEARDPLLPLVRACELTYMSVGAVPGDDAWLPPWDRHSFHRYRAGTPPTPAA